ncbi:MAG: SpoIIE family protein phosphatase [Candidatus Krumholzibacteriota bacterium]|nr:SpoIIE family protein phosphatase [Candidatus Krumholzibacteriota bacterium]
MKVLPGHAAYILAAAILAVTTPSPASAGARRSARFDAISIENGLSQSIVSTIAQDSRGFMWFGTEDGLNRYDGYDFIVLRHDPENENSLSYNHILSICADRHGAIWAGSFQGGLTRYEPATGRFYRYMHVLGDTTTISHNSVNVVYEDRSGTIWVGTERGLDRYDPDRDRFRRIPIDGEPVTAGGNWVISLHETLDGDIWIGTNGGGLCQLDPASLHAKRYRRDPANPACIASDTIKAILETGDGTLFIGTVGGGLDVLDRETGRFEHHRHDPGIASSIAHDQIFALHETRDSELWIGTNGGGLDLLNREKGIFIHHRPDPGDPESINYDEIQDIFEDDSGVLWIGTYGGGVNRFDRKQRRFSYYPSPNRDLDQGIIWSFCEDDRGRLWIGTHGGGLNVLDPSRTRYRTYLHDPDDPHSLSNDIVRSIFIDNHGTLWAGTDGGGLCRFNESTGNFTVYRHDPNDPSSLGNDRIKGIFEAPDGELWICCYGGGLCRLDRSSGSFDVYRNDPADTTTISNDYVRTVLVDKQNRYWVATEGGGLNRFFPATGRFLSYRTIPGDTTSLGNNHIFALHESADGAIWVATWGGGLNRFDPERGTVRRYTERHGLADNSIYGILEDEAGMLWLSTNSGICRFDPRTGMSAAYTVEDGLQSNEFNGGSFFRSSSGEMFFGGINGFNSFFPADIVDNTHVPPVVITSFRKLNREVVLDRPIASIPELVISHRDYVFSFEFAALDYSAPSKNRYTYRMEGLEDEWIDTDASRRFATFTTLSPGRYVFHVKGSNNDGVWNEEGVAITVRVTPPYWRTAWFRILVVTTLLAVMALLYRRRLRNVRMAGELDAAHKAQMSIMPHADPILEHFEISGVCIPANEVGGDFYDYFWIDEEHRRFGIAVGDVSGKAMQAAMIAVMSSGMLSSRAGDGASPAKLMTRLNPPLHEKTGSRMYTAMCLASLDLVDGTFTFSNAGFNDPLLRRNGRIETIEPVGARFPLGAFPETVYEERITPLERGNVLLLYSDGLTDAVDMSGGYYGVEALRRALADIDVEGLDAHGIRDRIMDDVMGFAGRAKRNDDITVVVVKMV